MTCCAGMLFLAGGNSSFRRDPLSTACLLISMCPRFPARSADHQYHLQPLRHLYVLAAEHRALHTIDVDSGLPVALNVEVLLSSGETVTVKAPGLLPELASVQRIRATETSQVLDDKRSPVITPRYYPVSLEFGGPLAEDSSARSGTSGASSSIQESIRQQKHLPPLFVKQVPPVCRILPQTGSTKGDIAAEQPVSAVSQVDQMLRGLAGLLHSGQPATASTSPSDAQRNKALYVEALLSLQMQEGEMGEYLRCRPLLDVAMNAIAK